MVEYDRNVIQEFAQRLYREAKTAIVLSTLIGLIAGAGFGYVLSQQIRESSPVILVAFSALISGAIGYVIGVARSFKLRLIAQTALCQTMIEANTSTTPRGTALTPARTMAAPAMPVGTR